MNELDDGLTDELQLWRVLSQSTERGDATNGSAQQPADDRLDRRTAVVSQCLDLLHHVWVSDSTPADDDSTDGAPEMAPLAGRLSIADAAVEPAAAESHDRFKRFGRFLIDRPLGRGGHGLVFRAIDPMLERPVALKIPNPDSLASTERRRRFVEESRTLARLEHPNLLPILEAGAIGPVCYLVTPFCAGPNLAEWLRRQDEPVACELAASLVRDLARTVAYVHSRGIMHRDIKPSNVLLEQVDRTPERGIQAAFGFIPKLADFGLAKLVSNPVTRTMTGAVVGTPAYMAPEQAEGRQAEVGIASDVYALGAMLYELLTGRPPYRGESVMETLRLISEGRLTPPGSLRTDLPRDLSAICLKCLEFEPGRRYRSADNLADDLTAFVEFRPVQARACGPLSRLAKWGRRRPLVASLAASLVLLALGGLTAIGWQWRRAEANRHKAEETFSIAHGAIKHVHDVLFEDNQDTYDRPEYYALQKTILNAAMPYYQQLLEIESSDPQLRVDCADVFMRLGHMAETQDARGEALEWFEESADVWQRLVQEDPANREYRYFLGKMQGRIGGLLTKQNDPKAGERLQQAAAIQEQLILEDPSFRRARWEFSETLCRLVHLNLDRHEFDRATRLANRAMEVLVEIPLEEREIRPMIQRILAEACLTSAKAELAAGKMDESIQRCRAAVELTRRLVAQNQDMPSSANALAQSLSLLAQLSAKTGQSEHSVQQYCEAVDVTKTLVSDYPNTPKYRQQLVELYTSLGLSHRRQNRLDTALEYHAQATAMLEQLMNDHPAGSEYEIRLIQSNYRMAGILESLDRLNEATAAMDRGKSLVLRLNPHAKSRLADAEYGMAELYRIAARIRTAAGDSTGGIEKEWRRELLQNAAP